MAVTNEKLGTHNRKIPLFAEHIGKMTNFAKESSIYTRRQKRISGVEIVRLMRSRSIYR